jgi:hypothetical protein
MTGDEFWAWVRAKVAERGWTEEIEEEARQLVYRALQMELAEVTKHAKR